MVQNAENYEKVHRLSTRCQAQELGLRRRDTPNPKRLTSGALPNLECRKVRMKAFTAS